MALHHLGPVLFSTNVADQINFLKSNSLLWTQQDFPSGGVFMEWKSQPTCNHKFTWRCPLCHLRKSIRNESYFSKSKLTLQIWLQLMHHWSMDMPGSLQAKIRSSDIYQYLQDVCSRKLLATPIMLGVQGVIVQIDESLYTPKRLTSSIIIVASILALFSLRITVAVIQLSNSGSLVW